MRPREKSSTDPTAQRVETPVAKIPVAKIPVAKILGSAVSCVTMAEVVQRIDGWIQAPNERPRFVVTHGFHGIWIAHRDPAFRDILNSADLFCPDGIAPVWLTRHRRCSVPERVPGPDMVRAFLELADRESYSSYFFGDTEETLCALEARLRRDYPGHVIAGTHAPPFRTLTAAEDREVVRRINDAAPDVLWVGLGCPKQERWIFEHLDRLRVPVVAGVGAAFKFLGGQVSRAPAWVGRLGFEWMWRLAAEPRRMWRRDFVDGPRFVIHALLEATGLRKYD